MKALNPHFESELNQPCEKLYEYRSQLINPSAQTSVVIQGRAEFIERFIPQRELHQLFGGCIRSRDWDAGQEYLGVWGSREASRFRRILRERGASFTVERSEEPPFRPKVLSTTKPTNESPGNASPETRVIKP